MNSLIDALRETSTELDEIIASIEENGADQYDEQRLQSISNELDRHISEGLPEKIVE